MFAALAWSADDDIPVPDGSATAEPRVFDAAWRSELAGRAGTTELQPLDDRRSSVWENLSDLGLYIWSG